MISPVKALILILFAFSIVNAQGIPDERLLVQSPPEKLMFAQKHIDEGNFGYAAVEISRQLEKDSTLLAPAATMLGGNYSLVRITDNVFADRVGGFSPSGNRLILARDTSAISLDDGFFNDYEKLSSRIVIYDLETKVEILPEMDIDNPYKPRFNGDNSFYFLVNQSAGQSPGSLKKLYLYDMELGTITECCELSGGSYCPLLDGVITYNTAKGVLVYKDWRNHIETVIFDNESLLSFKRPLPLIQNISANAGVIMFEAGFSNGKFTKNVYSIPVDGEKVEILTNVRKTFMSEGSYYPATVKSKEFAFISGDNRNSNIHYMKNDQDYTLTFDSGLKYYLAISPDGTKIAYSYMIVRDGVESYEIFMLDFGLEATSEDINYRMKWLK